jgi:hypothetical protein
MICPLLVIMFCWGTFPRMAKERPTIPLVGQKQEIAVQVAFS